MAQESGHGLAESPASRSLNTAIKVLAMFMVSSEGSTRSRVSFQTHVVVDRIEILMGCQTSSLISFWFLVRSCPQLPAVCLPVATFRSLHMGLLNISTCFTKANKGRKSATKTDTVVLCNIIMGVPSCYLCCILLVRSMSQVLPTAKSKLHN